MTYEEIVKASRVLCTTDIKGKAYVQVNERIKAFRMLIPNGTIATEIVAMEDGVVTMKTSVYDEQMHLLATGYAQEKESSSFINKTSYIENCETSAVGRALGMLGIGIDTSVCSAEELTNAINNQHCVCADCGNEIVSVTKTDGSKWEVVDMVKYSEKRFGRHLCGDCMKKEKNK